MWSVQEVLRLVDDYGNVDLSHTPITSLPEGLQVGGKIIFDLP